MTGQTIYQIKEEISKTASKLHFVTNCIVESEKTSDTKKIVIIINNSSLQKELEKLLKNYIKYGFPIIIREKRAFPFDL